VSLYPAYAREFIELRWKLVDTNNVDRVELLRNGEFITSLEPDVWRYEDTTAARDTTYTYELVSVDSAGQRSASVFLSARNDHEHYPVLAGEFYSSTLAELFWVDDGNDPFFDNRYYDIYRDDKLAGNRKALSWLDENYTPTGHHYFIDTNPERFRDDYRLRSNDLYLPPDAGTRAPASVGNPRFELLSPEILKISWDAAAWGVEPLRYELQRRFSDDELLVSTTDTFVTVDVPNNDYGLIYGGVIVTIDANGRRSSPMPFYAYLTEPLRALLPGEPIGLSATQTNDTSTTITWQISVVGTTPASFEIIRDGEVIARTDTPEFTDSGLDPDTLYHYRVRSLDSEGRRSLVNNQMLQVLTTGGPFLPERVDALAYGPTLVEVLWPRVDSGASYVTEYRVYRDGELIATVDALSLMDDGLVPDTTYTYAVRSSASGGAIVSEGSVTTVVTTPAQ
jgi:chitodextrinase